MGGEGWKRVAKVALICLQQPFWASACFFQLLLKSKNKTVLLSFPIFLRKRLDFPGSGSDLKKKK